MSEIPKLPERLTHDDGKFNLYHLNELYKALACKISMQISEELQEKISITSGMWGGSYLVANDEGKARTNVVRLYCLINLPQNTSLDKKENFERLMVLYHQSFSATFASYNLSFIDPQWGAPIPYSNSKRPTTTLQMWEKNNKVKFLRAFFVWNSVPWEDSVVYDTIRNIKVIKEMLDMNQRPVKRAADEYKFLLQDVLIIYYTLRGALSPDFMEHAEPIMSELLKKFLDGLHDPEVIEEEYLNLYSNAIVYGLEEALEGPYKKAGLDILTVENWPVEKINWVPQELRENLGRSLTETFASFKTNLEKNNA
ncbi:MAG: hypothetical protein V1244_01135 [Nitrospinaceae bacterium]|jgi:hypothetical protein|nr:hypothetical protein [Nitrospinota bacterium]MDP6336389.1 hypothetical protein [Nitrospinaceae bacterium]MDP7147687.1 hypothetical protein [Nitrospinaceae bacterium]MDP7611277.1 hypothetical protein [Nitrospinaceae bacterium]MEE1550209.1 hypothetical protein [Nitrospinaceae bacterium]|tara:strand:- start:493 stop:1425 length:933 start_codon:yes stop_codon:yes gene_type:complete